MKRRTARWSTGVAAAALLMLPAAGWTQSAPTTAQQPPAPSATATAPDTQQAGSAQDHLRAAKQALNEIQTSSVTGSTRTKIVDLKRHMNALERSAAANDQASATGTAARSPKASSARGNANWSTEVAAIDRILTELLGPSSATGAASSTGVGEPSATAGTTGTAGTDRPAAGSRASKSMTLDDATRSKLMEVRTHITAFASAMSGTSSQAPSPQATTAASATDPSSSAAATTTNPVEPQSTAQAQPPQTSPTQPQTPAQTEPSQTQNPPSMPTTQPEAAQAAPGQPDPAAAKQHLTAARDTLAQLTQLPAAAQLTGEARAQVSQLISNFNQLITTESGDWRPAYEKVSANVTALIGAQPSDESTAPATGTPGAVGTAGTATAVTLDPEIRTKLVEFRSHLIEFERAASAR